MFKYKPMNGTKYAIYLKPVKLWDQNISWQSDFRGMYLYCYCCNAEIYR